MISDRQQKLLKTIVEDFIETGIAVGSVNLLDKYNFELSSATIRNEMAELVFRGYLYKKHSSGGRIPTTKGWRFFVDELQDEIEYIDATKQPEFISTTGKDEHEKIGLIRQGLNFLSMMSENAALALVGKNVYYSGLAKLLENPEIQEGDALKRLMTILEDYYTLSEVMNKNTKDEDINILIGDEETGNELFAGYSVIYSELRFADGQKGFVAVIGPNRMRYKEIISGVKYISDTIRVLGK